MLVVLFVLFVLTSRIPITAGLAVLIHFFEHLATRTAFVTKTAVAVARVVTTAGMNDCTPKANSNPHGHNECDACEVLHCQRE